MKSNERSRARWLRLQLLELRQQLLVQDCPRFVRELDKCLQAAPESSAAFRAPKLVESLADLQALLGRLRSGLELGSQQHLLDGDDDGAGEASQRPTSGERDELLPF